MHPKSLCLKKGLRITVFRAFELNKVALRIHKDHKANSREVYRLKQGKSSEPNKE